MRTAGVPFLAVSVMGTRGVGVECEGAGKEGIDRLVGISVHTAVDGDARFGEGDSSPHTYAAADEHIRAERGEETSQRAVPVCGSGDDFRALHFAAIDLIALELLGMPEVSENVAVQMSYRDLHIPPLDLHRLDGGSRVFRLEDGAARDDDRRARLFATRDVGG